MFGLLYQTPPTWLDRVVPHLDVLLLEQAHLERKAAMSAMTLTFRYPFEAFQAPLSELAREEMEHFELVLGLMGERGIAYGPIQPSPYPAKLLSVVRDAEPERMLDQLVCSAVIEARSCERLKLLGEHLVDQDPALSAFYLDLVASEARHHGLYLQLAKTELPDHQVRDRLQQVLEHEAVILEQAPVVPRLHN